MKNKPKNLTPEELRVLFEALRIAPTYLSKRFILTNLCGWDDEDLALNVKLRIEEEQNSTTGNKIGGYK